MSTSPGPAPARGPVAGGRAGLSEYTAQRLAELRARRAEVESTDLPAYVKPTIAPRPSPSTSRAGSTTAADRPTVAATSPGDTTANGLKSETNATSASVYSSHRTAAVTESAASPTQSYSSTVNSPLHRHQLQQQLQQQYVNATTSRSPSSASTRGDMIRSHQVHATTEHHHPRTAILPFYA